MKQKFAEALRSYRKDVYKIEHDASEIAQQTQEALSISKETLDNAYHFHFHKLPDASRAEIINMINNYTLEALLPPVVEKITRRQVQIEKKLELLVGLLEKALEGIGEDQG